MMMAILAHAQKDSLVSVRQLEEQGLPRSFLVKIARDLVRAHLIVAKEGRGGGYSLCRKASTITLTEIVEAAEGQIATVPCLVHGAKRCPLADMCPHRNMMTKLTSEVNAVFSKYTLAEFAT